MCVICYIPKGVKTPSKQVLRAMHDTNPNGMGFCTPTMFHKGLSFDYFLQQLSKRDINEPCILHFLLATNGSIKRANCHPFKQGDVFFAHNGILSVRAKNDMTDSETAFINYLYPCIQKYGLNSWQLDEVVLSLIGGSKFIFMQGDDVIRFGKFIERGGCYYSNVRFAYRLH